VQIPRLAGNVGQRILVLFFFGQFKQNLSFFQVLFQGPVSIDFSGQQRPLF
jgi:hypothetical protein